MSKCRISTFREKRQNVVQNVEMSNFDISTFTYYLKIVEILANFYISTFWDFDKNGEMSNFDIYLVSEKCQNIVQFRHFDIYSVHKQLAVYSKYTPSFDYSIASPFALIQQVRD
jgi:hypothetical protein